MSAKAKKDDELLVVRKVAAPIAREAASGTSSVGDLVCLDCAIKIESTTEGKTDPFNIDQTLTHVACDRCGQVLR